MIMMVVVGVVVLEEHTYPENPIAEGPTTIPVPSGIVCHVVDQEGVAAQSVSRFDGIGVVDSIIIKCAEHLNQV